MAESTIPITEIWECCQGKKLSLKKHGKIFLYAGDSISARLELINDLKE